MLNLYENLKMMSPEARKLAIRGMNQDSKAKLWERILKAIEANVKQIKGRMDQ